MASSPMTGRLAGALAAWVGLMQRRAPWVVAVALLIGAGLARYAATHLSVDTDPANMLSPQLPWRQAQARFERLFPPGGNLVVVIDGDTPELADDAQRRLAEALRARPDPFESVYAPDLDPFFRRNGLLYLSPAKLGALSEALTKAQPFLGALDQDPSLHGLFGLLGQALTSPQAEGFDLTPALNGVADGFAAATDGRFNRLSWQDLMGMTIAGGRDLKRRFLDVTPRLDYTKVLAGAASIGAVRDAARDLHLDIEHGVRVRLTGSTALQYDELRSAARGAGIALAAAMVVVALLLYLGLRSARLVLAAVLALIYGLIVTSAFAAAAVGHLNLISMTFGILYVGLGIDYALYLSMQYRELLGGGVPHARALSRSAVEVGGFIVVCALAAALGFFAFIPTAFTGIAELGLIAGVGMFISLAVSLSLLPALITLMPPDPKTVKLKPASGGWIGWLLALPYTHARWLWAGAAIAAAGALALAPRAGFDYDPLDLRDPHAESVATYRALVKDPDVPALALSAVAADAGSAQALAARLAQLPLVKRALTLHDFVPEDQDHKLAVIDDLVLTLGPDLAGGRAPRQPAVRDDDAQALAALRPALAEYSAKAGANQAAAKRLLAQVERFEQARAQNPAQAPQLMEHLRQCLLGALSQHLASLKTVLQVSRVTPVDLPPDLVRRWRSADGHERIEIWPRQILDNNAAMQAFVDQVKSVAPDAVGGPVTNLESGHSMVRAFERAFLYSVVAITLLLLALLRSAADTVLVLIPLLLAGLLTVGGAVLIGMPFNFANVIALPLILGVGVDYGVYIVQRGRAAPAGVNLLHTSTARAVLFGALITMANFGNLMLAEHPGMASMGLLLTLGLGMTLLCALVLLPSLLARRSRSG